MLANWVKQAVSAGGTGNLTLGAADAGHVTLNDALGVGSSFNYVIEDGNDRETGIGRLSASTTLVRDFVRETLVSGTYDNTSPAAINVTTAAKVALAPTASGMVEAMPRPCGTTAAERRVVLTPHQGAILTWSTDTLAANFAYFFPVYWPGGRPIGNLYCDVQTAAAAGKLVKVGLAVPNDDWTACRVVVEAASVGADVTGMRTGAVATPVNLPPGWYVGIIASDGTPIMRSATQQGAADPFGWHGTTPIYKTVKRWKAFTFGAFPTTFDLINSTTVQRSDASSSAPALWAGE